MTFRWYFLAPLLGHLVVGGCTATDSGETKPTVTQGAVASFRDNKATEVCVRGGYQSLLEPVGVAVTLRAQARVVTSSCQCQTTTEQWGCGGKVCESEYDLGGPNTPSCSHTDDGPASISSATATVDRRDCSATSVVNPSDPGASTITVECATAGDVLLTVAMHAEDGVHLTTQALYFATDGVCPYVHDDSDAGLPSVDDDASVSTGDGSANAGDAGDAGGD